MNQSRETSRMHFDNRETIMKQEYVIARKILPSCYSQRVSNNLENCCSCIALPRFLVSRFVWYSIFISSKEAFKQPYVSSLAILRTREFTINRLKETSVNIPGNPGTHKILGCASCELHFSFDIHWGRKRKRKRGGEVGRVDENPLERLKAEETRRGSGK
jgi:hypothetical protein